MTRFKPRKSCARLVPSYRDSGSVTWNPQLKKEHFSPCDR